MSSLEGVKVGDMLAWDERIMECPTIARVERLTPKHVVAGKVRWRIIDGLQAAIDREMLEGKSSCRGSGTTGRNGCRAQAVR